MTIEAGKLVCFSRGEYDDYECHGYFIALQDLTEELLQEVVRKCRRKKTPGLRFVPALIEHGVILEVDIAEIHTGNYGRLRLS